VLSIEDNPADALLIREMLEQAHTLGWDMPRFDVMWVPRLSKGLAQLDAASFDVVLTDLDLPDSRAGETFTRLHDYVPLLPVVVLTGRESEELARDTVRSGAEDYLFKREMSGPLLAHALIYAIERQRAKAELQQAYDDLEARVAQRTAALAKANEKLRASEQRYRSLVDSSPDGIKLLAPDGTILLANQRAAELYGFADPEALQERDAFSLVAPEDRERACEETQALLNHGRLTNAHYRVLGAGGERLVVEMNAVTAMDADGQPETITVVTRDVTERRRIAANLRESEARLRAVWECASDAMALSDPDGIVLDANQAYLDLYGYTAEEIIGHNFAIIFPEEMREVAVEQYKDVFTNPEIPPAFESIVRRGDGTERVVESRIGFITPEGAQGSTGTTRTAMLSVIRDITERTRAEEELRESQRFVQHIAETLPGILYVFDLDQRRNVFINREVTAILGYSKDDIVALGDQVMGTLMHPEDFTPLEDVRRRLHNVKDEQVLEWEYRMRHKDGGWRWLHSWETVFKRSGDGAAKQILGVAEDVTSSKLMEMALRENQARLEATQVMTRTGGWEIDAATLTLTWTEEIYRIHEVDQSYVPMLEDALNFFLPKARPLLKEAMTKALGQGAPFDLELPFITGKGRRRWVRILGHAVMEDGAVIRVIGAFQDVTARRESQETLLRQAQELKAFASTLSHDLREPLRMVIGFLDLLRARCEDALDEQACDYIHYAVDGAERMRAMIDDLLSYSRLDACRLPAGPTDAGAILAEVLDDLQFVVAESDAVISCDTLPIVVVDPTQLRQVFQNLLQNALKFHDDGEPPRVHVGAQRDGSMWVFSVRDNGIGLATDHPEEIFQIFRRLHTREEFEGTGMGLAICKKVVERHGGGIWVESEIGEGSTFYFSLPAVTQ
jgi:PAS domain S-box-containing protein